MSTQDVNDYLAQFSGPGLQTAQKLRADLKVLLPEGEECLSYAMPAIKISGKAIAGYAVMKNHVGYYPHSSLVLSELPELEGKYQMSKGALQIPSGQFLPFDVVEKLVRVRLQMLSLDS